MRLRSLLLGLVAITAACQGATWDTRVTGGSRDNFVSGEFRLWVDDATPGTRPLRALLVLAPGWNGDARDWVDSADWQTLARELNAGLVGIRFRGDESNDAVPYHHAHRGSGAAWLRALADLAAKSRRPEVAAAPWLLWGHSAGGQLGYGLACLHPDRVVAFVATKGGIYETPPNPKTRAVPGLFVIGENDEPWRAARITELFERERRGGAAWAVAWEAGSGHEVGRSVELAKIFFREAAALRLEEGMTLRRLHVGQGWIGERASYTEAPWPRGPAECVRTVWLPGPGSGVLWRKLGHPGIDLDAASD